MRNEWMLLAYNIAKQHYSINKWNLKSTPVAVLVDYMGRYIAHGSCANGKHAIHATCNRLHAKGLDYNVCEHCSESEHAELKAIAAAGDRPLIGGSLYLYGHYKTCENCTRELHNRGIYTIYILENAATLFDRHNPNTVIGKPEQFAL